MTLKSYYQDWGIQCASCQYFTVYGDGLHRTIDWYFSTNDRQQVSAILDQRLTER